MTATIDRSETSPAPDAPVESGNHLLKVVIAVLAVVALVLAAVVVYDLASGDSATESDVPAEVQEALDAYYAGWEMQDADAIRAVITDDFALEEYIYRTDGSFGLVTRDADNIDRRLNEYTVENFGTPITDGEGPWYVSVGENWVGEYNRSGGVASYVIVEQEDGTLRIARHFWTGD